MAIEFGPFRLDEAGRVLSLDEREVSLQPLVFDLLVYLLRSRARVVSKEELLDALWPGVTVTENSLQRAVSTLRGVLRKGGMENSIRNFPRAGYRFFIDMRDERQSSEGVEEGKVCPLEAAEAALLAQRWDDAANFYAQADASDSLSVECLDGWAHALQCLGRPFRCDPGTLVRASRGSCRVPATTTLPRARRFRCPVSTWSVARWPLRKAGCLAPRMLSISTRIALLRRAAVDAGAHRRYGRRPAARPGVGRERLRVRTPSWRCPHRVRWD